MAILGDQAAATAIDAFGSVGTAMVTPFKRDGSIDYASVEKVANHLVELGNDMLVVSGTTGESPTTTDDEKVELLRVVRGVIGKRAKIIAGTGNNVTAHTIELSRRSADAGADGILIVTPYYSKPTQPAIEAHMRAAADSTDLPVMLYDIPGRAGAPIITDTLLRLSDHPNILAVKDAKGDLFASSFVMNNSSLVYYSGEDALNLLAVPRCARSRVRSRARLLRSIRSDGRRSGEQRPQHRTHPFPRHRGRSGCAHEPHAGSDLGEGRSAGPRNTRQPRRAYAAAPS